MADLSADWRAPEGEGKMKERRRGIQRKARDGGMKKRFVERKEKKNQGCGVKMMPEPFPLPIFKEDEEESRRGFRCRWMEENRMGWRSTVWRMAMGGSVMEGEGVWKNFQREGFAKKGERAAEGFCLWRTFPNFPKGPL